MVAQNVTIISVIFLLGLQSPRDMYVLVFLLLFLTYVVTICGNLLIIILVSYSETLHTPMYFFLSQLSVSDILLSSDIFPHLIHTVLMEETKISFSACITQFFFFAVLGSLECLLLTVMSYDRYLAICQPLHYTLIMNPRFCWTIVITIWALNILFVLVYALILSQLQYCGANVIDHFICDLPYILQLSCSDTTFLQLGSTLISLIFAVIPFLFIIVSYVYIAVTIFKIPSDTGRQKAFTTCSSHLTVVSIYYGPLMSIYLVPNREHLRSFTKYLALLYTVVTPLMNPIVYSLRNKDLKIAGRKLITNLFVLQFRKNILKFSRYFL